MTAILDLIRSPSEVRGFVTRGGVKIFSTSRLPRERAFERSQASLSLGESCHKKSVARD